jgi:SAM-dependent methyltransferase
MVGPPAEALGEGKGVEFLSPPEASDFPEEWYELGHADHFWFDWRLRALLGQVRDLGLVLDRPLRVLDVGAGAGVLRDQLEARTAWTVDIADLNATALRQARPGRGRTLCYNVLAPDPALLGRYDALLLFDVLEHIAETRPFVEAVLRHLRPGGHLLVNVPAGQWLFGPYDVAAGHVRRYDRVTLPAEFAGTELEVRDVRYWGLSLVPLLAARKLLVRAAASKDDCVRNGFEPPNRLVHGILRALLRTETSVLDRPLLGSSVLLAGQRRSA